MEYEVIIRYMNNTLSGLIGFLIGIGAGIFAGKLIFEKKANDKIQAEIDAIRSDYHKKSKELAKKNETKPEPEDIYAKSMEKLSNLRNYAKIAKENGYIPEESADIEDEEDDHTWRVHINIEEFAQLNGLTKETLTWFKDNILADEEYEIVDVSETVGMDAVDELMRNTDEAIYIRNIKEGADYELVYEPNTYFDVTGIYYDGGQ